MNAERRMLAQSAPTVDILVQSPLWQAEPGAEAMVLQAINEAAALLSMADGELAIVLTDDSSIRALNRAWRNKDEPTNVLSFPASDNRAAHPAGVATPLGDIVVAYETIAREAAHENKSFMHHLTHLAVHGFLHLLGYDHAAEPEATAMERLEIVILARLGVPDPYLPRDARA